MNQLLYFPYIELPSNEWRLRNLLYWDQIASIVPYEFIEHPSRLGSDMNELVREGLIYQVIPENYIYKFNNFDENFFAFLKTNELFFRISEISKLGELGKGKFLETTNIHMGKLSNVGDELVQMGLGIKRTNWYEVEKMTAEAFVTYLAFLLGNEIGATPVTDDYKGLRTILGVNSENHHIRTRVKNELRATILDGVLPVPTKHLSTLDILRFKEKYSDELGTYRRHIEAFILDVEGMPEDIRQERIRIFIEESQDNINRIKDKMRFFGNVDFSFVSLCSIASTVIPTVSAYQNRNLVDLSGAVPGLLAAVASTLNKNTEDLQGNPLAYASIIRKKLIKR